MPDLAQLPPSDAKAAVVQELQFQEVSKPRRILQVGIAILYCLFAAGVVFGYAAIKPVLIDEGVYKNYCTEEELREGTSPCYLQEIRLNLMFTIAAVSTNVAALPIGTILDRYGPRVCGIIGSTLLALGALLFAFAGQAYRHLHTRVPLPCTRRSVRVYLEFPIVQYLPTPFWTHPSAADGCFRFLFRAVPPLPSSV